MKRIRGWITGLNNPLPGMTGSFKEFILISLWFGLLTGLVEGVFLWGFQRLNWLAWPLTNLGISYEIVAISICYDVILFLSVGLILGLLSKIKFRWFILKFAIFSFVYLAVFDWIGIGLDGRVHDAITAILALSLTATITRWILQNTQRKMQFFRSSLPWVASVGLLIVIITPVGGWLKEAYTTSILPSSSPTTPNIVVVVVDSLRADHLSSYGYSRSTSPTIDRLAQEGALFNNAISTSSWTWPAHASMLTGRYTYEHGAELKPLDNRYPTIGEALQANGYRTGAFSANVQIFNRRQGYGRGFIRFEDFYQLPRELLIDTFYGRFIEYHVLYRQFGFNGEIGRKRASDINQSLLKWVDRDPAKPFFVFINYNDVHDPYVPPQPYRTWFSPLGNLSGQIDTYWDNDHIYLPLTADELQGEIAGYDGGIAYVDSQIGDLMAQLKQRGPERDTLLIILADHGEMFGEHGLFSHLNALYRELIHVPMVIWWPGHVPAGIRIDQPVSISSLPATILDLIGARNEAQFPNPSLAKLWEEPGIDWPDPVSELAKIPWSPDPNPSAHGASKSVITSQWHYIVNEALGAELYDWKVDPQESNNLIANPAAQQVVSQLNQILQSLK